MNKELFTPIRHIEQAVDELELAIGDHDIVTISDLKAAQSRIREIIKQLQRLL